MKFIILILALATVAFAVDDNCAGSDLSITSTFSEGNDGISLRLINNWIRPRKEALLGLDYVPGKLDRIIASDFYQQSVNFYSTSTGTKLPGGFAFDIENDHGFGIVHRTGVSVSTSTMTNDTESSYLFNKVGSSRWTKSPNPISYHGKGMDYDGTYLWTTCGIKDTVVRYTSSTAAGVRIPAPGIPADATGLTLFSYGLKRGIAVTSLSVHKIFFYEITLNKSLRFIGSARCPVPYRISASLGLTYSTENNHFYWTYEKQRYEFYLAEFDFDVTALDQSSWGSIKASF